MMRSPLIYMTKYYAIKIIACEDVAVCLSELRHGGHHVNEICHYENERGRKNTIFIRCDGLCHSDDSQLSAIWLEICKQII